MAVTQESRDTSSSTAAVPVMASTSANASPSIATSFVSFFGPAVADTRDAP